MKKLFLPLLCAVLFFFFPKKLYAQNPVPQWASQLHNSLGSIGNGVNVATDVSGNSYLLGSSFSGAMNADGHLSPDSTCSAALVSWNCNHQFRWMKTFGGIHSQFLVWQVLTDSIGGVYVYGSVINNTTAGSAYWGTDATINVPAASGVHFIVKYDTAGVFQWLRTPAAFSSTSLQNIPQLSVSPSGEVFWLYLLDAGTYSGGFTIPARGYYAIEYDASGNLQTTTALPITPPLPNYNSSAAYCRYDPATNRFYAWLTYRSSTYGNLSMGNTPILATSGPQTIIVLGAFTRQGTNLWVRQSDTNHIPALDNDLGFGKDGTLFLIGVGDTNTVFCGDTIVNSLSHKGASFIMALDSNGNHLWTSGFGSSANGAGCLLTDVCVRNNTVVVTGIYGNGTAAIGNDTLVNSTIYQKGFMLRLNKASGAALQLDTFHTARAFYPYQTAMDQNNNIYIAGYTEGDVIFANDTLSQNAFGYNSFNFYTLFKYQNAPCNCNLLQPAFTATTTSGATYQFSYTGQTPYTAISWDFGDGSPTASGSNVAHTYAVAGTYTACVTVTNSCGNNTTCHYINVTRSDTKVNTVAAFKNITLYPNPTRELLTINHLQSGTTIQIFDALGRCLKKLTTTDAVVHIPVENLRPGVHIVRFTDNEGRQGSSLFVKE